MRLLLIDLQTPLIDALLTTLSRLPVEVIEYMIRLSGITIPRSIERTPVDYLAYLYDKMESRLRIDPQDIIVSQISLSMEKTISEFPDIFEKLIEEDNMRQFRTPRESLSDGLNQ